MTQEYVERLERWCDQFSEPLPPLESFILPGGSAGAARLHVARTVARRAERSAWAAAEQYGTDPVPDPELPGGINQLAITYLNRLSDLLFILTRAVNGPDGRRHVGPGRQPGRSGPMIEATGKARPKQDRPVTLFTGQWADLPFTEVCRLAADWGYDGLEIACWGDHFDVAPSRRGRGLRAGPP